MIGQFRKLQMFIALSQMFTQKPAIIIIAFYGYIKAVLYGNIQGPILPRMASRYSI